MELNFNIIEKYLNKLLLIINGTPDRMIVHYCHIHLEQGVGCCCALHIHFSSPTHNPTNISLKPDIL
jgi:hypothetical protein